MAAFAAMAMALATARNLLADGLFEANQIAKEIAELGQQASIFGEQMAQVDSDMGQANAMMMRLQYSNQTKILPNGQPIQQADVQAMQAEFAKAQDFLAKSGPYKAHMKGRELAIHNQEKRLQARLDKKNMNNKAQENIVQSAEKRLEEGCKDLKFA